MLHRSLHAKTDAWIVSGSLLMGRGLQTSSSRRHSRVLDGIRVCSMSHHKVLGVELNHSKLCEDGCSMVVLNIN